jgi:IclR helix-turn-helix domain
VSSVMEDLERLEDRILARIRELEANVAELEQLREVARRLGILDRHKRDSVSATPRATTSSPARRRIRGQATATGARPGGARSATVPSNERSTRRDRVLEVVAVAPGISVREIVAQLGVNRTSLYPVVRQLVSDGLVHKDGRGLWLASR